MQGQSDDHRVAMDNLQRMHTSNFLSAACKQNGTKEEFVQSSLQQRDLPKVFHGNQTNRRQWQRHWFRYHSSVIQSCFSA